MKVFKKEDGKEVKGANVVYTTGGTPDVIVIDGVNYDPSAFELKDEETNKKTRSTSENKNDSKDSGAMTTKNTGRRSKRG